MREVLELEVPLRRRVIFPYLSQERERLSQEHAAAHHISGESTPFRLMGGKPWQILLAPEKDNLGETSASEKDSPVNACLWFSAAPWHWKKVQVVRGPPLMEVLLWELKDHVCGADPKQPALSRY